MTLLFFFEAFPELAKEETTTIDITKTKGISWDGISLGVYKVQELYCTDVDCACNMVKLIITLQDGKIVDFSYGWKNYEYYKKFYYGDEELAKKYFGLNEGISSGKNTRGFFRILELIIEKDKGFLKRIKKHYKMMKGAVVKDNLLKNIKFTVK